MNNVEGKIPGVKLYLIDHSYKEVIFSNYVTYVTTFSRDEINSNLYELRIEVEQPVDMIREVGVKLGVEVPQPISSIDKDIQELLLSLNLTVENVDSTFL